ncbi:MAG: ABC transporter substrate-binding protein, partial [Pseudomonadota bacterium]
MRLIPLTAFALSFATSIWADSHDITVSHGISAFGDLKYPADFPNFDYVNSDAPKGGFISFRGTLASQTFDSLNLFILDGDPAQGLERIYDTLLQRAWDEPDAAYGRLAESIEYPEDRSWVIFNLRPEARFSDGEPVTAEDVVFTIEMMQTEALPQYRSLVANIAETEILSDTRLKLTFADGVSTRDLIQNVGIVQILPQHYYETVDFTKSTLDPPVGSGPYVVSEVQPGKSITYCRNKDYWGAELPVNVGTYNFGCETYEYFADNTAAFEALKSGEYLFHEEVFSALWGTAYDFPALNDGYVIRDTIPDGR